MVAVGADNNTFNIPGVKEHAVFLKELQHARVIRSKIIEVILFLFSQVCFFVCLQDVRISRPHLFQV